MCDKFKLQQKQLLKLYIVYHFNLHKLMHAKQGCRYIKIGQVNIMIDFKIHKFNFIFAETLIFFPLLISSILQSGNFKNFFGHQLPYLTVFPDAPIYSYLFNSLIIIKYLNAICELFFLVKSHKMLTKKFISPHIRILTVEFCVNKKNQHIICYKQC